MHCTIIYKSDHSIMTNTIKSVLAGLQSSLDITHFFADNQVCLSCCQDHQWMTYLLFFKLSSYYNVKKLGIRVTLRMGSVATQPLLQHSATSQPVKTITCICKQVFHSKLKNSPK